MLRKFLKMKVETKETSKEGICKTEYARRRKVKPPTFFSVFREMRDDIISLKQKLISM